MKNNIKIIIIISIILVLVLVLVFIIFGIKCICGRISSTCSTSSRVSTTDSSPYPSSSTALSQNAACISNPEPYSSDNNILCFWTGTNKMSNQRKESLQELKNISQCNVILITPYILNNYILDKHPLHPSFKYLSETHKADYLRTYFMRFHGGGYSDIKRTTGSWLESFEKLKQSDKWIIGYKEVKGGVAYSPLKNKWKELIGLCSFICKPNTPLVIEWYNEMMKLMDDKYIELKKNPATFPQDCKEKSDYPIEWNEMLGRIFHKVLYKYKNKSLNTLPISIFHSYR